MSKKKRAQKVKQEKERRKKERTGLQTLVKALTDIVELWPWKHVEQRDLFAYAPAAGGSVVLINCVRSQDDSLGLMLYPTLEEYRKALQRDDLSPREAERSFIEMEAFTVFFGEKEKVTKELLPVWEQYFPKDWAGPWPRLGYKRKGTPLLLPTEGELDFLTDCLTNFVLQLRSILERGQRVDFEQGEMLLRYFNKGDGLWYNVPKKFELPEWERQPLVIKDDAPRLQELLDTPFSEKLRKVEFDFGWLREPVWDEHTNDIYHPVEVVFTDRDAEEPLLLYTCRPEELAGCSFTAWYELIQTYGRPETLYFCRDDSEDILGDCAEKLGVKCKRVKRLPSAEKLLKSQDAL